MHRNLVPSVLGQRHPDMRLAKLLKAERFIQMMLRQWAYVKPFRSVRTRANALEPWIEHYNRVKPHASLEGKTRNGRLRAGV